MDEKTIDSFDGTKIFYRIKRQKGPFLVLLHGGSGSSGSWLFQKTFLEEKDFSLIIPDLRGHGLSARGEDLSFFAVDRFAQDIKAILDKEQLDRVVLVGHSLGGQIAQKFYQLYPEKVEALVLISTKIVGERSKLLLASINLVMRLIFTFSGAGKPNNHYTDYSRFTHTADLNPFRILSDISCCSFKTYAATIIVGNSFENKAYKEIKVKSLLIHGKKDMILPYREVQKIADEMKNFELALLPTNHITLFNTPEEVNQLIGSFLQTI
jgi:pimeloyl-ACP methyl ester carboxylesterase